MKKTVRHYQLNITDSCLPEGTARLAFLSDLHNCSWGRNNDQLIRLLWAERPDAVLCGGDMITAYPGEPMDTGLSLIRRLSSLFPVYLGVGNHELRLRLYPEVYGSMYEEYLQAVGKTDAIILSNACVSIQAGSLPLCIYGLDIPRFYYKRFHREYLPMDFLYDSLGKPQKNAVNVLMAHLPRHMRNYLRWGADLVLSGHCHGGIVGLSENRGLISPDFDLMAPFTRGSVWFGRRLGIISAGLGEHTLPVRIRNPRELDIIDIRVSHA